MLSEMKQENNSRMLSHPNKRNSQQKKFYSKYSTRLLQNPSNKGTHGRRGPGLYRSTVNELSLEQTSLPLNLLHKRLFKFKPSLTPGLGTRRVVSINPSKVLYKVFISSVIVMGFLYTIWYSFTI